ncbi:hypothetical protein ACJIZ3_008396 [Penstemon smallii]|uniref:Uncharacterized protein n=1 Tax=Penstemon smallii TaxID=265156 RepID=A0ABD3T9L5_9LAMI
MVPVNTVWDSVQLYSVRCEECSKWRIIPSKEKYEEIRENFNENSFTCAKAREWRPQVSCQDKADIEEQDDRYIWAMDKPNIPKTCPGWQRLIRMRAPGGKKFADVYYIAPSKKRMRSMVELDKFFEKNPVFLHGGINTSMFSFQAPVPLDENYIAKRRSRAPAASGSSNTSNIPLEGYLIIPSKEKYEEIREKFNENSFTCAKAREWRPQVSCQDPADIEEQDDMYIWAMDKPNIPRTCPGWQRLIRMRAPRGKRFVDV